MICDNCSFLGHTSICIATTKKNWHNWQTKIPWPKWNKGKPVFIPIKIHFLNIDGYTAPWWIMELGWTICQDFHHSMVGFLIGVSAVYRQAKVICNQLPFDCLSVYNCSKRFQEQSRKWILDERINKIGSIKQICNEWSTLNAKVFVILRCAFIIAYNWKCITCQSTYPIRLFLCDTVTRFSVAHYYWGFG